MSDSSTDAQRYDRRVTSFEGAQSPSTQGPIESNMSSTDSPSSILFTSSSSPVVVSHTIPAGSYKSGFVWEKSRNNAEQVSASEPHSWRELRQDIPSTTEIPSEDTLADCFDQFDDMFDDNDSMICGMSKAEYDNIVHELSTTGTPLVAKSFARSHTDTLPLNTANLDIVYGSILDAAAMALPLPINWHKRKRFSDVLQPDNRIRPVTSREPSWTPSDPLKSSSSPEAALFADEHEINKKNIQQSISDNVPDKHYRKTPESNTGTIVYPSSGSLRTPQSPTPMLNDSSDSEAESLVKEFGRHDISNRTTDDLAQRQHEAQLRSAPPKARNIANRQQGHIIDSGSSVANQSQSPSSNGQCEASQHQLRDSETQNSMCSALTPASINSSRSPVATIKNGSSSPVSQTKSAHRTQSSLGRKSSLEGRGRKLFTVQIETDSQLHKYPVHEYDDPAMLAREIHVKFKDNIVFHKDWRACLIALWERKIQRLAEKDQAKRVGETVSQPELLEFNIP